MMISKLLKQPLNLAEKSYLLGNVPIHFVNIVS